MSPVSRGFHRRHQDPAETAGRVPPGQYLTKDLPLAYACGPTSFVETVSQALVQSGYPPQRVKTERFGATGGT
jgi:ferredoxin-NADP reductase